MSFSLNLKCPVAYLEYVFPLFTALIQLVTVPVPRLRCRRVMSSFSVPNQNHPLVDNDFRFKIGGPMCKRELNIERI